MTTTTHENATERKELTFDHKDFICKHIPAFKSCKEVAELFLRELPDSGFTLDQVLKWIKDYACDNRTRKWRFGIIAYRDQLNHNLVLCFINSIAYFCRQDEQDKQDSMNPVCALCGLMGFGHGTTLSGRAGGWPLASCLSFKSRPSCKSC